MGTMTGYREERKQPSASNFIHPGVRIASYFSASTCSYPHVKAAAIDRVVKEDDEPAPPEIDYDSDGRDCSYEPGFMPGDHVRLTQMKTEMLNGCIGTIVERPCIAQPRFA